MTSITYSNLRRYCPNRILINRWVHRIHSA